MCRLTEHELESLEAEANKKFREVVPVEKIDPVHFENSYYLACQKGTEKPYRLMAETRKKPAGLPSRKRLPRERKSVGRSVNEQRPCDALHVFRE